MLRVLAVCVLAVCAFGLWAVQKGCSQIVDRAPESGRLWATSRVVLISQAVGVPLLMMGAAAVRVWLDPSRASEVTRGLAGPGVLLAVGAVAAGIVWVVAWVVRYDEAQDAAIAESRRDQGRSRPAVPRGH